MVENVTGACLSKNEGDRESSKPTRYLATTWISQRNREPAFALRPPKEYPVYDQHRVIKIATSCKRTY